MPAETEPYISEAYQRFRALTVTDQAELAEAVFRVLEFDRDGRPGVEWSSDTLQDLSGLFVARGVIFSAPDL
jgi:hypothetical protein